MSMMLLSPPVHPFPPSSHFSQPDTGTLYFRVIYSAGPKDGGLRDTSPPEAVSTIKNKKNPDYCWKNVDVGVGVGTHRAASVIRACKWWDFKISCSLVGEEKTLLSPPPSSPKQNSEIWGWCTYPQSQGCGMCAPSPIFHSVVASIANSM